MAANLFTGEAHHTELVLVSVEVEHVADIEIPFLDGGIEG